MGTPSKHWYDEIVCAARAQGPNAVAVWSCRRINPMCSAAAKDPLPCAAATSLARSTALASLIG